MITEVHRSYVSLGKGLFMCPGCLKSKTEEAMGLHITFLLPEQKLYDFQHCSEKCTNIIRGTVPKNWKEIKV